MMARSRCVATTLKWASASVEIQGVKACPYCDAELRDSVIRCTRCLQPLGGEAGDDDVAVHTPPSTLVTPTTASAPAARPGSPPSRPPSEGWTIPPSTVPSPGPLLDLGGRRALPASRRRGGRPDLVLLLASLTAAGAAYLGWTAVGSPWVELVITDTSDRLDPVPVGEIVLRGQAALIGTIGLGLAAALGALGVLWLFYGFDRASTMPWFVSPAFAIVAAVGGVAVAILASSLWLVWKDAAVHRARAVRTSPEKLRELLDLQPPPLVEIHRLDGLTTFGAMMLVGLLGACAASWSYRRRG